MTPTLAVALLAFVVAGVMFIVYKWEQSEAKEYSDSKKAITDTLELQSCIIARLEHLEKNQTVTKRKLEEFLTELMRAQEHLASLRKNQVYLQGQFQAMEGDQEWQGKSAQASTQPNVNSV